MLLIDKRTWRKGVAHLKRNDRVLAKMIGRVGEIEFRINDGPYEHLVNAIIYQQISGAAGASISKRFRALYGGKYPTPGEFLKTEEKRIRQSGISPQKLSYIKDICDRTMKRRLRFHELPDMSDEQALEHLDEVRGVGRWTAEMVLIFALGRTDILPMGDLGIRNAVKAAYGLRKLPSKERFEMLSRKWHPYCTIASLYLWRSIDPETAW
jgi:DNA-3-methyladenine glycosylase II